MKLQSDVQGNLKESSPDQESSRLLSRITLVTKIFKSQKRSQLFRLSF